MSSVISPSESAVNWFIVRVRIDYVVDASQRSGRTAIEAISYVVIKRNMMNVLL